MKNALLNKFRTLARLLALTLVVGTGQAQAVPFLALLAAAPPVVKVASVFVGTIAGGYVAIEGGKWATGYEDPDAPGDENKEQSSDATSPETNRLSATTDSVSSSTLAPAVTPSLISATMTSSPVKKKAPLGKEYTSSKEFADIYNSLDDKAEKEAMKKDVSDRMEAERTRLDQINKQIKAEQEQARNARAEMDRANKELWQQKQGYLNKLRALVSEAKRTRLDQINKQVKAEQEQTLNKLRALVSEVSKRRADAEKRLQERLENERKAAQARQEAKDKSGWETRQLVSEELLDHKKSGDQRAEKQMQVREEQRLENERKAAQARQEEKDRSGWETRQLVSEELLDHKKSGDQRAEKQMQVREEQRLENERKAAQARQEEKDRSGWETRQLVSEELLGHKRSGDQRAEKQMQVREEQRLENERKAAQARQEAKDKSGWETRQLVSEELLDHKKSGDQRAEKQMQVREEQRLENERKAAQARQEEKDRSGWETRQSVSDELLSHKKAGDQRAEKQMQVREEQRLQNEKRVAQTRRVDISNITINEGHSSVYQSGQTYPLGFVRGKDLYDEAVEREEQAAKSRKAPEGKIYQSSSEYAELHSKLRGRERKNQEQDLHRTIRDAEKRIQEEEARKAEQARQEAKDQSSWETRQSVSDKLLGHKKAGDQRAEKQMQVREEQRLQNERKAAQARQEAKDKSGWETRQLVSEELLDHKKAGDQRAEKQMQVREEQRLENERKAAQARQEAKDKSGWETRQLVSEELLDHKKSGDQRAEKQMQVREEQRLQNEKRVAQTRRVDISNITINEGHSSIYQSGQTYPLGFVRGKDLYDEAMEREEQAAKSRKAPEGKIYQSSREYAELHSKLRGQERKNQEQDLHRTIRDEEKRIQEEEARKAEQARQEAKDQSGWETRQSVSNKLLSLKKAGDQRAEKQMQVREEQRLQNERKAAQARQEAKDKSGWETRQLVSEELLDHKKSGDQRAEKQMQVREEQRLENERKAAQARQEAKDKSGWETRQLVSEELLDHKKSGDQRAEKQMQVREEQRLENEKKAAQARQEAKDKSGWETRQLVSEELLDHKKSGDQRAEKQMQVREEQRLENERKAAQARQEEKDRSGWETRQLVSEELLDHKKSGDQRVEKQMRVREEQRLENERKAAQARQEEKDRSGWKTRQSVSDKLLSLRKAGDQRAEQQMQVREEQRLQNERKAAQARQEEKDRSDWEARQSVSDELLSHKKAGDQRAEKQMQVREEQRLQNEKRVAQTRRVDISNITINEGHSSVYQSGQTYPLGFVRGKDLYDEAMEREEQAAKARKAPEGKIYQSSSEYAELHSKLRGQERVNQEQDLHKTIRDAEKRAQEEKARKAEQARREAQQNSALKPQQDLNEEDMMTVETVDETGNTSAVVDSRESIADDRVDISNITINEGHSSVYQSGQTYPLGFVRGKDLYDEAMEREGEREEQAAKARKAPEGKIYQSSSEYAELHNKLRGQERKNQEQDLHRTIRDAEKRIQEEQTRREAKDKFGWETRQSVADELLSYKKAGEQRSEKQMQPQQDEKRAEQARQEAKDQSDWQQRQSYLEKLKGFGKPKKQPQTPVPAIPEEEKEEEPETPPLEDANEDFINRTNEFEDELNDESEKNKSSAKDKPKTRKPGKVPKLSASAETHLQGTRALAHGSALMTMETMSGFRNAMSLYRSGRAFSFGTASLDNLPASELLASTDPVYQPPVFNREVGSWHNFVQVHGLKANRNQVSGLPGGSISGQGMTAGAFYQLNPELVTGVMLSVHKNTYGFQNGMGSGSLENVRIGPFLSWTRGDFHLDASLTLAHNNYSLKRKDSVGNGLKATFSGHEIAAYTGIGYDIPLDSWVQGLTLTPMAELLYVRSQNSGYSEEGNSAESMKVSGGSGSQLITRYGLEAGYLFPNLESPTELKLRLGRQKHNMAGQSSGYTMQGGGSGTLSIPAFSENATFVGLGFHRKVSDNSHISLSYNGTRAKAGLSHGLQLNFESKF